MSLRKPSLALLLFAIATGCNSSSHLDPYRAKLILKAEPAGAKTPTEVRETITEPTVLTVAGRIDAGDIEPFQDGLATFMLSQLPDKAHADDPDHPDHCPYCKRKLANAPKVVVQFLDDDGKVLALDARELFGIAKGDSVVVQGKTEYLEAVSTVQVNADGIFIRK